MILRLVFLTYQEFVLYANFSKLQFLYVRDDMYIDYAQL